MGVFSKQQQLCLLKTTVGRINTFLVLGPNLSHPTELLVVPTSYTIVQTIRLMMFLCNFVEIPT